MQRDEVYRMWVWLRLARLRPGRVNLDSDDAREDDPTLAQWMSCDALVTGGIRRNLVLDVPSRPCKP